MSVTDKEITEMDRIHRDANIQAMRHTGFKRRVFLAFSRFAGWAGDLGREIQRDERRGDDDKYHGEY